MSEINTKHHQEQRERTLDVEDKVVTGVEHACRVPSPARVHTIVFYGYIRDLQTVLMELHSVVGEKSEKYKDKQ